MTRWRWLERLRAILAARRLDADLDEEVRAHLGLAEEEHRAAGMSPGAARAAARRAFGSVARAQERTRENWTVRWLQILGQDLRYAFRTLRKSPGFTLITVSILALGIGANTAIFTLVDQILLRLLPVPDADELVLLSAVGPVYGDNNGRNALSHPMYRDFRDHNQVFSGMFARFPTRLHLTSDGQSERVAAELVSGTFFPVLRVGAARGRTIAPEDDRPTAPESGYDTERAKLFFDRLTDELAAVPGVSRVGLAAMRILASDQWDSSMTVEGYSGRPGAQPYMNAISPGYFAALGVPILAGRDFVDQDRRPIPRATGEGELTPAVVIVNETFARRFFGGRNPVGQHVGFGSNPGTPTDMEIVGLVRDIKYQSVREEIPPQAFVPYLAFGMVRAMGVYLRTAADPEMVMSAVRARVAALDANVPIYDARTMEAQLDSSLTNERLIASLCTVFGALAALLAIIGLYGVVSYNVARRTREIGIRMALGALRRTVIGMVMREVLVLVAIGVIVGLAAALALGRLVESQLYGLPPHDLATMAIVALGLALVSCAAGYLPALRASRLDPIAALKLGE